jgi:hypothetical protein
VAAVFAGSADALGLTSGIWFGWVEMGQAR